jgi:hypothetical protein
MIHIGSYQVVGSPVSTVVFSNIPQGFEHLQVIASIKTTRNYEGNVDDWNYCTFNGDGSSASGGHYLSANGSSVYAGGPVSSSWIGSCISSSSFVSNIQYMFAPYVIDILDYSKTDKFKTYRSFYGFETGTLTYPHTNVVGTAVNLWRSTNAVTSITFSNFVQWAVGSRFDLYGIPVASETGV